MKILTLCISLITSVALAAQVKENVQQNIKDNGKVLIVEISYWNGNQRLHVKKNYLVEKKTQEEKNNIVKRLLDSLKIRQ